MDLIADKNLLWIAREGFAAPPPEPWILCRNEDGEVYFVNKETNDAVWEHPLDAKYKAKYREEKEKLLQAVTKKDEIEV